MSRILPLPPDAISQIHSSKHITSLQGVVFALLDNCLDAGATKVDITLDFHRGGCTVEDNGIGIPPTEFVEYGGLGRMYHTSKRAALENGELHGKTGTFLASLAALSLLVVTSRQARDEENPTLTMHHGKVLTRQVTATPMHDWTVSDSQGTKVTVRDLFGNMPVRVKQRAMLRKTRNEDDKAWHELKYGVVALLLAWPKPCAVKLRLSNAPNKPLNLSGSHPSTSVALTERSLNQLGGANIKFDLRDALPLVFQAGLAPVDSRQHWVPVSTSTSNVTIKGVICLEPMPTKQCQFISCGIHPCSANSGHNVLYESVNKVFANSSFGAVEDVADLDEAEKDRRKRDRRYKNDGYTQKQLQGRKGVDRWPMFVLQVKSRDQQSRHRIAENPSDASLAAIVDILEVTVTEWLAANHFRPQKRRRRKNEQQQGPNAATSSPSCPASSTIRASNDTLGATGSVRPSLKRPRTTGSTTASKKRRVLDIHGRPVTGVDDLVQHSPSSYFNTLGRIKSGRGGFYDDLWDAKKPATAPSGQLGPAQSPAGNRVKAAFHVPVLEAGALNAPKNTPAMSKDDVRPIQTARMEDQTSSDDFGSVDDAAMLTAAEGAERGVMATENGEAVDAIGQATAPDDPVVHWTDPITKKVFEVNARTGVVLPFKAKPAHTTLDSANDGLALRSRAAINTLISSAGKPLSLARRSTAPSRDTDSGWLPGFLKDWNNPVFQKQDEARIPVASFEGPGVEIADGCKGHGHDHRLTQHFAEGGASGTSKLSKAALLRAKVIKQVDAKFILCKMPSDGFEKHRETLVLVDQHAASERVILEGLLAELCQPANGGTAAQAFVASTGCKAAVNAVHLERPQRFHISVVESELFAKHAAHFARWGILYDLSHGTTTVTASQVRAPVDEHTLTVRTLPPGIAERCALFPNLLIELLRSEIWALVESTNRPRTATQLNAEVRSESEHDWLRQIGSCPKGVLDMLNSRACRSAIMFNDVLSVEQCEELLSELAMCAFPFMCAHGRVSMVPLVELGGEGVGDVGGFGSAAGAYDDGQASFAASFERWRRVRRPVNSRSGG